VDRRLKQVPGWISGTITAGVFGALLWMEWRRPLRKSVEPKLRRNARNLAVAASAALALRVAEQPIVGPLSVLVARRRWGLLQLMRLPLWIEIAAAVLLMDYTLYWWHVATHRIPWLWRFHVVHHVDLDLDASTAIRFHFGELTQSVAWRAAQVMFIGVTPLSLSIWQALLLPSILFHHSNVRLSHETERRLTHWVVTPRMHGIHHSTVREETDSNWSSGFTIWDRIHGTLRLDVPRGRITIGVPACQNPEDVTLPRIIAMPFGEQRPAWETAVSSSQA
jgi:sterol desaturase/sphingolipid hydroxylase (fatty acid hydroxylase superfamily)